MKRRIEFYLLSPNDGKVIWDNGYTLYFDLCAGGIQFYLKFEGEPVSSGTTNESDIEKVADKIEKNYFFDC